MSTLRKLIYHRMLGGACCDCVQAICNDDYSGMSDAREAEVRAALAEWTEVNLIIGDELGFSWSGCTLCGGRAGDLHEVGYLHY